MGDSATREQRLWNDLNGADFQADNAAQLPIMTEASPLVAPNWHFHQTIPEIRGVAKKHAGQGLGPGR
jgi:hypothetical protein